MRLLAVALDPFAKDLVYVALLFTLFVVPRALQRYRVPGAVTSLVLGVCAGPVLGLFPEDATIELLSSFGIVSLFLFAGLDVDFRELLREKRVLSLHLAAQLLLLAAAAAASMAVFPVDLRAASLLALALVTPSTGFILDALAGFGLSEREQFWVRGKAIATELVALAVLFVALQSTTIERLSVSAAALAAMVALLPVVFRIFAAAVVPYAPKSEFAFLIMVAVVCAIATRELGVYYLVGAFVVGLSAQRFRERLPAIASEKMIHAVEAFASVFVPFYFFHAGLTIRASDLTLASLGTGAAFLVVAVPLRAGAVALLRKLTLGEGLRETLRVGLPLLPTLVFTLVLAGILRDRLGAPPEVVGGLVIYTVANTLIPGLVFRAPPAEFETPQAGPPGAGTGPAAEAP